MGNEMGNGTVNGLRGSEQDMSNGTLEPSSSSSHDTGLRIADAATAELKNLHERKVSGADNCTSEADDIPIQMQGMSTAAEKEEKKQSCANITIDTGEILPNASVLSDMKGSTNEQLFSIGEGTLGVDAMTDKRGECSREPVPHKPNIENGPSAEEIFMGEDNALELETSEKDSILKGAEAREITVICEGNVADENNRGLDDEMGAYSREPIFQRSDKEIEPNEEKILLKGVEALEMEIHENGSLLKEPEAHVVNVVGETIAADENSTEDGEYYLNGLMTHDMSQLDSQSIEHEGCVYLETIDAQIKDALMKEKEEEAEKVSQAEAYEFKPVLTATAAKTEECLLKKEETTENMCRSTIEFKVDGQTKYELMEEEEEDTEKVSPLEGYQFDPNPTTATVNHEEYLLEKEGKVDYTCSGTSERKVESPINEPEKKDRQVRSKEPMVDIVLPTYDICGTECMNSNEHFHTQNLQTEKCIEGLYEEKNMNTNVHCEVENKHVLLDNQNKERIVILNDRSWEEYQTLENSETQCSVSSVVSVGTVTEERVEKVELLIVKEDTFAEETRLACGSLEEPLKEEPSTTNLVQEEQATIVALSGLENMENSETESSLSSKVTVERVVEERVEKAELLVVKEDSVAEEIRLPYGSLDDPPKAEPSTTNSIQEEQSVIMAFLGFENTENSEPQSSLSSMVIVERAVEERVEKAELVIAKEDSVSEEIRLTYGSLHEPPEEEPSTTNSVQEEQLANSRLNTISPRSGLPEQDRDLGQPDNIPSEYFTGQEQACAPMQSKTVEYKEKPILESYPEICSGNSESSGQPCDFPYEYSPEPEEPNVEVQSETTEKKEISTTESDSENYILLDFNVRKCSNLSLENLNPSVLNLNSPIEGKDTTYFLEYKKDPSVDGGVIDDAKDATCMTDSDLDGNGVNASDEGTNFSCGTLVIDPVTLETAPEVENKRSIDEEEETQVRHEILHESDITSCGGNEQLLKSAGEPHEDLTSPPVDHNDGLGDSNHYPERPECDRGSIINWNHNVLDVDTSYCGDTRSNFEKSIANSEHATPRQDRDDSNKKPEDQLQSDNEPQEEVKSIVVEHQSVQHSMVSNSKSQVEECRDPTQEVPTIKLNQEAPAIEIAESRDASTCGVMSTMNVEASAATRESGNSDSSPPQHMTSVKGLISVFERSGFDAQTNSMKPISALQVLQTKSSKADSISIDQCGSNITQGRSLPEGDIQPQSSMQNAKANLPATEAGDEQSDQNQLPQQQKSGEEVASTLGRTSSERLRAPLLSFFKDEVTLMKSQEKGDNAPKNASDKTWRSPSKKFTTTSPRRDEKQKSKSSFFSNCMCCTTVPQ